MESKEKQVIRNILTFCDFNYVEIKTPQKGYRNTSYPVLLKDKTTVNAILFKHEPGMLERIKRADNLSEILGQKGFPTRRPLGEIIVLKGSVSTRYARCYNYLPGTTIPWEAYTMKHIKLIGQTLAQIHQAAAASDVVLPTSVIDECLELSQKMDSYFAQDGVQQALRRKLSLEVSFSHDQAKRYLDSHYVRQLPQQSLHMDFVRGNILFDDPIDLAEPRISGIIDFEKAATGPVVFDIARTLAFLLVDCRYKPPRKVYKYFVQSGYIKRGQAPLDSQQLQLLSKLSRFYLMYDFYKFLKHNPYESLQDNIHFTRTRDFLLQDGMISYIGDREPSVLHLPAK